MSAQPSADHSQTRETPEPRSREACAQSLIVAASLPLLSAACGLWHRRLRWTRDKAERVPAGGRMRHENKRLKVCHIFAGTEGGRWVYEQLDALGRDHDCETVALLGGTEGPTVDLCRNAGIRTEAFDFRVFSWRALPSLPFRILKLALWLRRERFDVVQSHILPSTFFARPSAWLADVPVRLTMSTSPYYMQAPSIRWMEVATVGMETGMIPSCAVTADLYAEAGVSPRLIQPILYYGPHEDRFD